MPDPVVAAAAGEWTFARQDTGGSWDNDLNPLTIAFDGTVSYEGQAMQGAVLNADGISWPADGNPFGVTATLLPQSFDPEFWPQNLTLGPVLQGTISAAGGGTQPFRADRAGVQTDMCWFMNFGTGAFLAFWPMVDGTTKLKVTDESQIWRPQKGVIETYLSNSVLFLDDPPAAGSLVQAQPWDSSPQEFWDMRQTSIIPKEAPDLRLVPRSPSGATVAPASADPAQAWLVANEMFYIVAGDGRSLSNDNGTLVLTDSPGSDFQRRWVIVGGFVVSGLDGSYVGVSGEAAPGATVVLGAFQGAGAGQWLVRPGTLAPLQQPKLLLTTDPQGTLALQPGGAPGQAFNVMSAGPPGQFGPPTV
jgi:hypothetical protein